MRTTARIIAITSAGDGREHNIGAGFLVIAIRLCLRSRVRSGGARESTGMTLDRRQTTGPGRLDKKIGLVLPGGGARGAYQVGVLKRWPRCSHGAPRIHSPS